MMMRPRPRPQRPRPQNNGEVGDRNDEPGDEHKAGDDRTPRPWKKLKVFP